MDKCRCCQKPLSERDRAAYGGRCEDCWARSPGASDYREMPASGCYTSDPVGKARTVSNQIPRPLNG